MRPEIGVLLLTLVANPCPAVETDLFRAARFREHVEYLAGDELEGRQVGSEGSAKAADYIARQFKLCGLAPGGEHGTDFQPFQIAGGLEARNIVAVFAGAGGLADQCVIVSAHYDHLGKGKTGAGPHGDVIYNGADDNASGVAAMLLIAEALARDHERLPASRRTVIFAAFDAEESGLLGAQHYAEHPAWPLDRTAAILNFDMVGRLQHDRLYATDAESSPDLARTIKALEKDCGLLVETRIGGDNRGDQAIFLARRLPGLRFLTGIHSDYHRVTDELGALNCDGGARVARLGYRLLRATIEQPGRLAFRKVDPALDIQHALALVTRLGMFPEVNTQDGRYPLIRFILPGSPAAKHGLKSGDRITSFNGIAFTRVEEAMLAFPQLSFEQGLRMVVLRDGKNLDVTVPAEVFEAMAGPPSRQLGDGRFEVAFRFTPPAGAKAVFLAGTFNDWKPGSLKMDGPDPLGRFTTRLELERGTYEYKFVVEGERGRTWHADPDNLHQVGDFGNSVLWVGLKPGRSGFNAPRE